jgi:hypothetical protein
VAISTDLTAELKKVVLSLEDDLRDRVATLPDVDAAWRGQHAQAVSRERTAMSWQAWRDDRVTQAAVAWVLTSVFVRFCEDNRLVKPVWIAGPGARRQEALDAQLQYFRENPEHTDREWLLQAVEHFAALRATRELVGTHSPLWTVSPSGQAVQALLTFWRQTRDDGSLVWDFTDEELSTRFLGDLYQDLSDYAKKTFALLQTPEFVEEFILDQTMEPALAERPLEGFRMIDPTCGSGHFLLGAFARLNDRWAAHAPGLEPRARVQKALDAVHGVDLNPFAVAIARFRLMVAALQACGETSLEDEIGFTFHLAAGDSLLHGGHQLEMRFEGFDADAARSGFAYDTEELAQLRTILQPGRYDVVVGNPPYILPPDPSMNSAYRDLYSTCYRKYQLTVPFMERFFELCKPSILEEPPGWSGQITSNAFMKREFGSKLIEEFLPTKSLELIVDTAGASIPGHGTPTVIIIGKNARPITKFVKAVLGVRGEPGQPSDPAHGLVWSSIVDNISCSTFENEFVSITALPRTTLENHPWSLSGGGAEKLLSTLTSGRTTAASAMSAVGFSDITGEDDVYLLPPTARFHKLLEAESGREFVEGERVRDHSIRPAALAILPTSWSGQPRELSRWEVRHFWPFRTNLRRRIYFGKTPEERGLRWFDHAIFQPDKHLNGRLLTFAFVSTHNHFVVTDEKFLFNKSAPVVKLAAEASWDDHLALAGLFNSSAACFWLKSQSYDKGTGGELWERRVEFTGTTLQDFPIPNSLPLPLARDLYSASATIQARFLTGVPVDGSTPSAEGLEHAELAISSMRGRMVALQEELDWEVYRSYDLIDEDLTYPGEVPEVRLGERAFEIVLARAVAAGGESTAWFARHGSTPVTEIPSHWPDDYRALVQRRLDAIESDKYIRLLEKPEYKRRWATEPWEKQVERALRGWLLDRLEDRRF